MNSLITSQLVEAHQHCPQKAFFSFGAALNRTRTNTRPSLQSGQRRGEWLILPPLRPARNLPMRPSSFPQAICKPRAMP